MKVSPQLRALLGVLNFRTDVNDRTSDDIVNSYLLR